LKTALLLTFLLVSCTPVLRADFPSATLQQLNQLEKKPEVYLKSPTGGFLITNNTKVELFLQDGRVIVVSAAEIFVQGEQVILRGRAQQFPLSLISSVSYTERY
jgi:hypothetical protein